MQQKLCKRCANLAQEPTESRAGRGNRVARPRIQWARASALRQRKTKRKWVEAALDLDILAARIDRLFQQQSEVKGQHVASA